MDVLLTAVCLFCWQAEDDGDVTGDEQWRAQCSAGVAPMEGGRLGRQQCGQWGVGAQFPRQPEHSDTAGHCPNCFHAPAGPLSAAQQVRRQCGLNGIGCRCACQEFCRGGVCFALFTDGTCLFAQSHHLSPAGLASACLRKGIAAAKPRVHYVASLFVRADLLPFAAQEVPAVWMTCSQGYMGTSRGAS